MANLKPRIKRLEATALLNAEEQFVVVERVIVGQVSTEGSPVTIIRKGKPYRTRLGAPQNLHGTGF